MKADGSVALEARRRWRCEMMARVQNGDRDACRELLDDIGPAILNFLRRRVTDRDELEDVYQETMLAFFQARHTFQPSRPLEPWLFAIARNVAADHARRHWTRASWLELAETLPDRPAESDPATEGDLGRVLAELPPGQREAFEMLKIEGLSLEQAAARAGTSVGALKVRAHRAYTTLKKRLLGGGEP